MKPFLFPALCQVVSILTGNKCAKGKIQEMNKLGFEIHM